VANLRSKPPARSPRTTSRKAGVSFTGSMGRAGNSRAFRIEAAFFKAAPEFAAAEKKVRVDLIGPGKALVSVDVEPAAGEDPVIGAWLSFLARDMQDNPQRMTSLSEAEAATLEELVKGVKVRDDETIPDDVTF
jgi:antitoxin PrlF